MAIEQLDTIAAIGQEIADLWDAHAKWDAGIRTDRFIHTRKGSKGNHR